VAPLNPTIKTCLCECLTCHYQRLFGHCEHNEAIHSKLSLVPTGPRGNAYLSKPLDPPEFQRRSVGTSTSKVFNQAWLNTFTALEALELEMMGGFFHCERSEAIQG
jgi:hypothetical protein